MDTNKVYSKPELTFNDENNDSARCTVGAVAMFGAIAIYWAGAVATLVTIVTHTSIVVTGRDAQK